MRGYSREELDARKQTRGVFERRQGDEVDSPGRVVGGDCLANSLKGTEEKLWWRESGYAQSNW